ncbi:MAG: TetR/AcrR family transcriptional regulator [Clostridiales bacterium]|jgi:AcrR family transcriptional regulator|nr:TetR/AcrR family transcriptional regulator [Clostridiales bacterium]
MPKIFDDETREDIRSQMLDNGFSLIKRFGLKKTTIEDVTRASGVAKGTFYNFFKTKEEFVYQIVIYKRRLVKERYMEMVSENGGSVDRRLLRDMLYFIVNGDYNLITYLNRDDMAMLAARWPKEYLANAENDEKMLLWILERTPQKRGTCDWRVFTNIFKIVAMGIAERDKLHEDALDATIDQFVDGLVDYVFEADVYPLMAAAH